MMLLIPDDGLQIACAQRVAQICIATPTGSLSTRTSGSDRTVVDPPRSLPWSASGMPMPGRAIGDVLPGAALSRCSNEAQLDVVRRVVQLPVGFPDKGRSSSGIVVVHTRWPPRTIVTGLRFWPGVTIRMRLSGERSFVVAEAPSTSRSFHLFQSGLSGGIRLKWRIAVTGDADTLFARLRTATGTLQAIDF